MAELPQDATSPVPATGNNGPFLLHGLSLLHVHGLFMKKDIIRPSATLWPHSRLLSAQYRSSPDFIRRAFRGFRSRLERVSEANGCQLRTG